jgi:hypothetical protein
MIVKQPKLHITGLYTLRPFGAWAPKKPSWACALGGIFLRRIFMVAGTLRVPLSQPQKRRIAGTSLGETPQNCKRVKIEETSKKFRFARFFLSKRRPGA